MFRPAALRAWRAHPKPPPPSFPSCSRLFSSSPVRQRRFSLASVSEPTNQVQMYISRSLDPYLNLSIEHYLLEKSPPGSVVLFLYTNRPCVVIGRNQNPWFEVNLGLVRGAPPPLPSGGKAVDEEEEEEEEEEVSSSSKESMRLGDDDSIAVDLVRRRSGGGTVFHDLGNANYSVLCPPADFDRDKHAEMVVRGLRALGATTARVNERHDIVIEEEEEEVEDEDSGIAPPPPPPPPGSTTTTTTAAAAEDDNVDAAASSSSNNNNNDDALPQTQSQTQTRTRTFKISGSAYKLTRKRALHHGTCLLASPNLGAVGRLLRSPAEPYIKARGVASVRSPIRNVGVAPLRFRDAVVGEFQVLYGGLGAADVRPEFVGAREAMEVPELVRGYEELMSKEWLYTQTPQFTLSTQPTADDPRPRPPLPDYLPPGFRAEMTVRHGQITAVSSSSSSGDGGLSEKSLVSTYLHEVPDWRPKVGDERVGRWLNGLLGIK